MHVKSVAQRSFECAAMLDCDFDARIAALMQTSMALPALELHDALHRLAIDKDALLAKRRPDHPIAEVGFLVDDVFDALREDLVNLRRAFTRAVGRGTPCHV